jgi:dihydrofolate synthase/folylpolyglutamate synthase
VIIKPGLERIQKILTVLDNPQNKYKTIHVAGTNGKGTVVNVLAQILKANGYKTAAYFSPHIFSYTKRFQINSQNISQKKLDGYLKKINPIAKRVKATEFEVLTAVAFLYFADQKVDYAVMETGLGGRWDATNVIVPEVSVITSIGMDHMDYLGNTIQKIASEKLGIVKAGVPLVAGDVQGTVKKQFIQKTKTLDVPITFVKRNSKQTNFDYNILIAKNVAKILKLKKIPRIIKSLPGRMEVINQKPLIIFDGAHNPAAIANLVKDLKTKYKDKKINYFVGILARKDAKAMVKYLPKELGLISVKDQENYPLIDIKDKNWILYKNFSHAVTSIKKYGKRNEVYVLTGSFYLVGAEQCSTPTR